MVPVPLSVLEAQVFLFLSLSLSLSLSFFLSVARDERLKPLAGRPAAQLAGMER